VSARAGILPPLDYESIWFAVAWAIIAGLVLTLVRFARATDGASRATPGPVTAVAVTALGAGLT
jgi:hypothetical protein